MADVADIKDNFISFSALTIPDKPINSSPYLDFRMIAAMMTYVAEVFCGTSTGTGSAIDVACPFDPRVVILINETDPGVMVKLPSMAGAESLKMTDADGNTMTYATADGITLGAKGAKEFTIGADADMNEASDVLHWVAFGGRGNGGSA